MRVRAGAAGLVALGTLALLGADGGSARRDVHSFGNPEQVRVTRVELDLEVDFARKELRGSATLRVARQPGAPAEADLVLDTRDLKIERVEAGRPDGPLARVESTSGRADPILGTALTIRLPEGAETVRIAYRTAPGASAVQWLSADQTAGGLQPFLFTQSQAIHARSWIPIQDSPGVRLTYSARITVPRGLRALMSADHGPVTEAGERLTYAFTMPQAIPAYLMALAVGDLAFRPLGPRTGVYAEPSVVERAAAEFADTEAMVAAAERRFGPYRWGRYDLLVLPPSFPYGGMENPKLTFATPTILAGDRSLVALVAHELAHSWSGNLVTNATWRDFWLNEGFTTYLERRIVEDVFGPDRAAMEAVIGLGELRRELKDLPPRDQVLHLDLNGRDPDEGVTRIPYEKGALFLKTLERGVGREAFDPFLRGYFDHFAFQSITTADFLAYLRAHLLGAQPEAAAKIPLEAWVEEPGLPARYAEPASERLDRVVQMAKSWAGGKLPTARLDADGWSTPEWVQFLRTLPGRLPVDRMAELDAAFGLTGRGNNEIVQPWLLLAVRSGYSAADARLDAFLTTIGRRKYVVPLYNALAATPEGRARALAIYRRARPRYHPITVETIDKLVGRP